MVIFHNRDRPNYEEVISYGPKWLTEFREMDANYRYAGWTLDLMAYWLERTVQNNFPLLADEASITNWEKFLMIEYDPSATLEERRRTVAIYYYFGFGKFSRSAIIGLIMAFTGCGSDVSYDGLSFLISVDARNQQAVIDNKVLNLISRRMPSHLGYSVDIEENAFQTEYIGYEQVFIPNLVIEMEELDKAVLRENFAVAHVMTESLAIEMEELNRIAMQESVAITHVMGSSLVLV